MNDVVDVYKSSVYGRASLDMGSLTVDCMLDNWSYFHDVVDAAFKLIIGQRTKLNAKKLLSYKSINFWFEEYRSFFYFPYFLKLTGKDPYTKPQQYARSYIGTEFDYDYINKRLSFMKKYLDSSKYNDMFINNKGTSAMVCNYSDDGYCGLVDHFDFGQLYPHLVMLCVVPGSKTHNTLNSLIGMSMLLKRSDVCGLRPIIKLVLNSYWGLVSCSDESFKEYMLTSERYMIHRCLDYCDGVRLIKTDGIYASCIDFDGLKDMLLEEGDFPIDIDHCCPISILNKSNYIFNGDFVGSQFRNGLTHEQYYGPCSTQLMIKCGDVVIKGRNSNADSVYSKYKELLVSYTKCPSDN